MALVRVAVRVRPLNKREKQLSSKVIIHMRGNTTAFLKPVPEDELRNRSKIFSYDFSFDSTDRRSPTFASQEQIYHDLGRDALKAALEGFNVCMFAYGQTASGKSYTMMGHTDDEGLIPRICRDLFCEITQKGSTDAASFNIEISYLAIYNERVYDLLRKATAPPGEGLRVREHPLDGPYVQNLSKHLVRSYSDVEELIALGNANCTASSAGMSNFSSRSHTIFTVGLTQAWLHAELPRERLSKINLVDLAGSEKSSSTWTAATKFKEGANINKSLVTLGSVISILADLSVGGQLTKKRKQGYIPYRDSVLTWLLKDSLGGNSLTTMIATISPADVNYIETLNTLRYASRAKNIVNSPMVNEDGSVKLIRELRAKVTTLHGLLEETRKVLHMFKGEGTRLDEELHQNEERVLVLTQEWASKWEEMQSIFQEETVVLRKEGSGVVLHCQLPHLIGIDGDLLSTGILLCYLKEGKTLIGSDEALCGQGIVLHGSGLLHKHCVLENRAGMVTLIPQEGALCAVNGSVVSGPCQLTQGAVTKLGKETTLWFNHSTVAGRFQGGLPTASRLVFTDTPTSTEEGFTALQENPGFELDRDTIHDGVSTRDGQEKKRHLCHKSAPGLMSDWLWRKAESGEGAASRGTEEVWSGDASLQQTGVLGPGDGCGAKPSGDANEMQGVVADCYEGRPGSSGSSLSSKSHLRNNRLPNSLGLMVCKVSWFVQDLGRVIWRSPTLLRQVKEDGLQLVGARWSSHFVALFRGSKVLSLANDSKAIFTVTGNIAFSLVKDSQVCFWMKELGLVQHSQMLQNLPPEEEWMVQGSINPDTTQCSVLTPAQPLCKAGDSPDEMSPIPEEIWTRSKSILDLQSTKEQDVAAFHEKQKDEVIIDPLPLDDCEPKVIHASDDRNGELKHLGLLQNKMDVQISSQTLLEFPYSLLSLQHLPLLDLMDNLQSVIPTSVLISQKIVAVYWLNVSKCAQPEPRPGLLVLMESGLYTLTTDHGPLLLFHNVPWLELKEVQISLGGYSLRLMGTTEESILGVYTHGQMLTKELCRAIIGVVHHGDTSVSQHPLLHGDLMKISLDWEAQTPDLLLDSGLRIFCRFQKSLADLLYLLHCNMDGDTASLGQVQLLLYVCVGVRLNHGTRSVPLAQLLLTDTHLGLVQEDAVYYPAPFSVTTDPHCPRYHDLTLRQRSDVRCVLVHDEDEHGAVTVGVFLSNVRGMGHPESATTPPPHASHSSPRAEVWELTFGCSSEATCLINHLSND
ncbi:kinesin-like protein KIF1C [Brachionichthys hirsutus]|uniref:kinesin-like protein KIF1C n=1 Tax=Brachionichthys hirsutus TaxID=412623 RepID=UPI0036043903